VPVGARAAAGAWRCSREARVAPVRCRGRQQRRDSNRYNSNQYNSNRMQSI
jgi:hypothetical protein